MRLLEYVRGDESCPYADWFNGLKPEAAAKVAVAKARLSQGNTSSIKWFDGIGEHKIDWGPGYRIYLAMDGKDLIILYGGGTKASQRSDIEVAKALHAEYKAAKKALSTATGPARGGSPKRGKTPRK